MGNLAVFQNQKFINVETVRKNGATVKTPVWFAEENGKLYVWTQADSGKVKRARNNSRVRVAVCDARGNVSSEWQDASVRVIDEPASVNHVSQLERKKYGVQKMLFDVMSKLRNKRYAALEISLM
jgi:PPOX class probable F420-dependent enzyme